MIAFTVKGKPAETTSLDYTSRKQQAGVKITGLFHPLCLGTALQRERKVLQFGVVAPVFPLGCFALVKMIPRGRGAEFGSASTVQF